MAAATLHFKIVIVTFDFMPLSVSLMVIHLDRILEKTF